MVTGEAKRQRRKQSVGDAEAMETIDEGEEANDRVDMEEESEELTCEPSVESRVPRTLFDPMLPSP